MLLPRTSKYLEVSRIFSSALACSSVRNMYNAAMVTHANESTSATNRRSNAARLKEASVKVVKLSVEVLKLLRQLGRAVGDSIVVWNMRCPARNTAIQSVTPLQRVSIMRSIGYV